MNKILFFVCFMFLMIGCPKPPVQPHPTPIATDTEFCYPAETNLTTLCNADSTKNKYCCDTVAPTKKGKTFSNFCQETQLNGVFINPKCLSTATSCDQIDVCTSTKTQ